MNFAKEAIEQRSAKERSVDPTSPQTAVERVQAYAQTLITRHLLIQPLALPLARGRKPFEILDLGREPLPDLLRFRKKFL